MDEARITIETENGNLLSLTEEELDNYLKNKDKPRTEEEIKAFAEGLARYMKSKSEARERK